MVTFTSFFPLTERLCWVFVAVPGFFSSCGERGLLSSCGAGVSHCSDFFCRRAWALECSGFSSSSTQGQSFRRWDLIGPRYVGSSWTRDQTCVPSIDRWILNHWATREVPVCFLYKCFCILKGCKVPYVPNQVYWLFKYIFFICFFCSDSDRGVLNLHLKFSL